MINIFEYTDFRHYLREWLDDAKKRVPALSHRFLAAKLGLRTPNLILLVIQGRRSLTPTVSFKLSKFLKHSKKESFYFEHMVSYLQSKTHEERNRHYLAMLEMRQTLSPGLLEKQQYDYYSNWYNPVIRELATGADFSGDFKALAKKLSPAITPAQAQRSIKLLLSLGLIRKNGDQYVQSTPFVTTGPIVDSIAVANFHRKTALLAAESFDRHIREERTITSCTMTLSEEHFQTLKQELADVRKRALELAQKPMTSSRVYQLNLQLFPMSRTVE